MAGVRMLLTSLKISHLYPVTSFSMAASFFGACFGHVLLETSLISLAASQPKEATELPVLATLSK